MEQKDVLKTIRTAKKKFKKEYDDYLDRGETVWLLRNFLRIIKKEVRLDFKNKAK